MKKPDPINKVKNQDEFSSGLMEQYGKWMGGDCFQNTQMPELHLSEAPFDGMDPQSNGAEIEQTSIKKKEAKKPSAKAQLAANEEVLEREEYEVDGQTYVIEKKKGLDGKACWKGYKLAGTKKKGGKTVDNCVKAGDEIVHDGEELEEGMKQARDNVGASTCWDGYKAKGTKKKGGKEVPNCVKEEEVTEHHKKDADGNTVPHEDDLTEAKKGLYANIHAKRKRGEAPAKPGSEDYPAKDAFKKAAKTAKKEEVELTEKKKLDPVGKADKDIDNDGDHDESDKYLIARRKKVSKIIGMTKKKK